jgi:monofunctional biosynthetic peptidoglycan transglycosylase
LRLVAFTALFRKPWFLFFKKWSIRIFLGFIALSILLVLLFKWVNPSYTFTMMGRKMASQKNNFEIQKTWVPIEKMGKNMQLAVICGEDQHFTEHHGFDFKAIRAAVAHNTNGGRVRGASTISQQTAKNVFLWNGRSYLRKGLEAWFTLLIEVIWGKKRIMEVYLNIAETGDGIFGTEAAARKYFGTSCNRLNRYQAAALASIFPSPRRWHIGRYPASLRQRNILTAMNNYGIQLNYLD